jgi:hypothetical protein
MYNQYCTLAFENAVNSVNFTHEIKGKTDFNKKSQCSNLNIAQQFPITQKVKSINNITIS